MDLLDNPLELFNLASFMLLFLLYVHRVLINNEGHATELEQNVDDFRALESWKSSASTFDMASTACLHHYRLWTSLAAIDEDLGFWVKPRSTTWFSRFLLNEYDDSRWIQMFKMSKKSVFSLTHLLASTVKKKDTKYRLVVPVTVRVACTLFKLSHGASLLICSELFAVGRSIVSKMLWEVVQAINVVLRSEICWPSGDCLQSVTTAFKDVCGLPGVAGAIDGTHIAISKPRFCPTDYFYFKSRAYNMTCQAVVDSSRHFLDLHVGMPSSTNDSRVLRRSSLFHYGVHGTLWDPNLYFYGFAPYLLGDAGYSLLPWLMVPHRHADNLSIADRLFNRKLSKGRACVENAFALLKLTFRELHGKTDLHVTFVPDVVICCAILHNVLLKQSHEDVERLLEVIRIEDQQN